MYSSHIMREPSNVFAFYLNKINIDAPTQPQPHTQIEIYVNMFRVCQSDKHPHVHLINVLDADTSLNRQSDELQ